MKALSALGFLFTACVASRVPVLGAEGHAPKAEGPEPRAVHIAGFKFSPGELTVSLRDTVTWTNDDTFVHTTTADSGAWTSPELGRGQRFVFVAAQAGRFPYHCAAHPVMRATIVVRE